MTKIAHFTAGSSTQVIGYGQGHIQGFVTEMMKTESQVNIFFIGEKIFIKGTDLIKDLTIVSGQSGVGTPDVVL